ncbi:MAG: IS110 family transposase [Pseudomonadota bacterium]
MDHIAIDLGGIKSQVCHRKETGEILEERLIENGKLGAYLQGQPRSRVVMETCSESWAIGDLAREAGHDLRIVPAHLIRALGVGYRRLKNDIRDARVLSEVSTRVDLPSVHLRSVQAREIQTKIRMRSSLVSSRTMLINNVRGWMRTQTIRIRTGAVTSFPERLRAKVSELPSAVVRQVEQIQLLTEAIGKAHEDIEETAQGIPGVDLLRSVPGVGTLTALAFLSTVDQIDRFRKAHRFQSYVGLTPGEKSSSGKRRTTSITKAGSSSLRFHLVQAAWTLYVHRPHEPLVCWAQEVEKRRGRKIAMVALARKLAGVLFAVWKTQRPYQPIRTVAQRS